VTESLTIPRPRQRHAAPRPAGRTPQREAVAEQKESAALYLIAISTLALGAWLLASHYVLGYPFVEGAEDAFFNELLAGVIVLSAGYGRLQSPWHLPKLTALQIAAGSWLVAAPWVVAYAGEVPTARANDVACGLMAVLLAVAAAATSHRERRAARTALRTASSSAPADAQAEELQPPVEPVRDMQPAGAAR